MLAFGLHADEGVPAGPKGTLNYAANVLGVIGRLESFEDGELESVDSGGTSEEGS
jgi:hypothetical protein